LLKNLEKKQLSVQVLVPKDKSWATLPRAAPRRVKIAL
jgi:hypothetical protein